MPEFAKRLYSPALFDGLFAKAGATAVIGIMLDGSRAYPAISPAAQPLLKGSAICGGIIVAILAAIVSTRHDQKHADDFLFNTLTKSSLVALFTLFFTLMLWQLFLAINFGAISTPATIGVLIASWSGSYFYTRVRGTGA